jgi:hypothetical protein
MTLNNEQIVRQAYQIAEEKDLKGWVNAFTADGMFTDNSIGVVYRVPDGPTGSRCRSRTMRGRSLTTQKDRPSSPSSA